MTTHIDGKRDNNSKSRFLPLSPVPPPFSPFCGLHSTHTHTKDFFVREQHHKSPTFITAAALSSEDLLQEQNLVLSLREEKGDRMWIRNDDDDDDFEVGFSRFRTAFGARAADGPLPRSISVQWEGDLKKGRFSSRV